MHQRSFYFVNGLQHITRALTFDKNIDLLFCSETWATENDFKILESIKPPGYYFASFPRKDRRGGGIGILLRSSYIPNVKQMHVLDNHSFEAAELILQFGNRNISFICVYKPPKSERYKFSNNNFFKEFSCLVDSSSSNNKEVIFVGDYNVHYDNLSDSLTKKISTFLSERHLCQLVTAQLMKQVIHWTGSSHL